MLTAYHRDRETQRKVGAVRVNPQHWASINVHAFRTWTGEHSLSTWCGIEIDLADGARQTTDTITCSGCAEASWQAYRATV